MLKTLRRFVKKNGKIKKDYRLNRQVSEISLGFVCLNSRQIKSIMNKARLRSKYVPDWKRMSLSMKSAVRLSDIDPSSRRLLVLNTSKYNSVYQCFNLFHFIHLSDLDYRMFIYQRSGDTSKVVADYKFFGFVAKKFCENRKVRIKKITILYGSFHTE